MDIVQIIYEQFNDRSMVRGSEYEKLSLANADNEIKLRDSLSEKQQKLLDNFNQSLDKLAIEEQFELIRFVLQFVSETIHFSK